MTAPPNSLRTARLVRLSTLGLLTLVVYASAFTLSYPLIRLASLGAPADIGAITGYTRSAAALYVGSLVLLFILYVLAIWVAAHGADAMSLDHHQAAWVVFGVGAGAVLLLSLVYPYGAADIFIYIVSGRVLGVYGLNSTVVPPAFTSLDGYLPFASEWTAMPSPYGPLWEWVAAGLARLGDGSLLTSLLAFKGWAVLCYLGSGVLIYDILWREQRTRWLPGLVALLWNPLLLLETAAMGHNDILMAFFIVLAVWFSVRRLYGGILVALVLGALVKYLSLVLVPLTLIWMARRLPPRLFWSHALGGLFASLLLAVVIWGPLWPGWTQLAFLPQIDRGHFSLGISIILWLRKLWPSGDFYTVGLWAIRGAFAAAYAVIIARALVKPDRLAELYLGALYAWLIFGAFAFGYWYIIWLVVLLPLAGSRQSWLRVILFCFTGLFSVALYTFGDHWFPAYKLDLRIVGPVVVLGLPWLLAYILDRLLLPLALDPVRSETG